MIFGAGGMEDLSFLQGAFTLSLLLAGALATLNIFRRKRSAIPRRSSLIPYVGSGAAYFAGIPAFVVENKKRFGGTFSATIFGKQWIFLDDKEDINSLMKSPEKQVSMFQAVFMLAGKLLPRDDPAVYPTSDMKEKISRGTHWEGVTAVPFMIHSVKRPRLQAWIPEIRNLIKKRIATLPESGQVDLFPWCRELVANITSRMIFGADAAEETVAKWVELSLIAEPEKSFRGPLNSIGTLMEVAFSGERKIYEELRQHISPDIEREIERCIAGEPESKERSVISGMVRLWFTSKCEEDPDYLRAAKHRIANDLFMFTFASVPNTFGAAAWVLFHVIRNTNGTGDRIREEIKTLADDSTMVPELESTIYEIARLYTSGSVMRLLLQPWEIPSKGEIIPAGSVVAAPVFTSHRNPQGFSNPLEFDPTRFGPDRNERKTAGSLYMPFGAGTHPCPGRRFAILEVAIFVSELLKAFDWSLVDDADRAEDTFTQSVLNVPRHPPLNPKQTASIWRTTEPLLAQYERKSNA